MNLLKKYKEQIQVAAVFGAFPALIVACQVLDLCKHC